MNNIHLHIFGSKVFFNLIEELNLEYMSVFEKNNISLIENNFSNNEIRIVFVEGVKLIDLKIFFKQNVPTIFLSNNKDYILKNKLSLLSPNFYFRNKVILFLLSLSNNFYNVFSKQI